MFRRPLLTKTTFTGNQQNQKYQKLFVPIRSYDNYVTANMELGMLQNAGIECHLKDEYTITIDPLLSPALGGMKLMVEQAQAEEAMLLLREAAQEHLQTVPCPVCKKNDLEFVTETTHHNNWLSKLKSRLVNGQEEEVRNFYRCRNCKAEFRELPL